MQFKSVILAIAASLALVHAAAVPAPPAAPTTTYDTCIDEFRKLVEISEKDATEYITRSSAAAECGTCLLPIILNCLLKSSPGIVTDQTGAKNCYITAIASCKANNPNAPVTPPTVPKAPGA